MAAPTLTLVLARANALRYLVTADAGGGGPTTRTHAQLLTDTTGIAGPIRNMVLAQQNGYGALPAGTALSQADARSMFFGDSTAPAVPNNANIPCAETTITSRTGATIYFIDANAAAGDATLEVSSSAAVGGGTAYLDITVNGVIGN